MSCALGVVVASEDFAVHLRAFSRLRRSGDRLVGDCSASYHSRSLVQPEVLHLVIVSPVRVEAARTWS